MSAIFYMALKDLRLLFRDRFGLFWIFVFPLIHALFFGTIFGGSGPRGAIPVVVIDEANSAVSQEFASKLAQTEGLGVSEEDGGVALEGARELVRKGERVAYIRIPAGYGGDAFAVFQGGSDDLVEIGIDPSRQAERGMIEGLVSQVAFQNVFTQFSDSDVMSTQIAAARKQLATAEDLSAAKQVQLDIFMGALDTFLQSPDGGFGGSGDSGDSDGAGNSGMAPVVEVVEVSRDRSGKPKSSFELTFPAAIVWALMGCVATFSLSMVRERTMGTLLRLRVAPLSLSQILAGKALACFLACAGVSATLFLIGWSMLGVRITSGLLMLAAVACSAWCFTGIMMLVSVSGKTENGVGSAGWGVMMPLAMVGGGMIPLMAMPDWLISVSHFSPFKWAIYSLEGAVWRNFTFSELLAPLAILVAIGGICFAAGVYILRRTVN